ncbi:heparan-alpha-glucosaminide N-acetyltransferase domain-containing protein [Sphingomonas oryzagri]|uniref:Heparan-alpha-glucosaminide N-acetyltransferase domain-containing protein n=1 Tax=Sphingomonas oryzagri TaxID=3042314 RepID=A0ABT6MXP0_9SPHN|nr:heparan-alpha-glucosaminide N-acetyltransferase domain-containing protein [Sphingomonas oryzagri]MDH7637771.1 heparan-alpha-glucosaminide N-acetyltransferase domain-containing protein [Sphingomonas oryzagri]
MSATPAATGPLRPHDRAGRRLASLDLLRGLSVIGMILVNLMAGMSHRGPVFPLLLHSRWAGFTIADAIFPAFVLMVGVSVALTARDGTPDARRILLRAGRLVLLGLLFSNLLWLYDMTEGQPRLPGVLQRIGLVFAATALVYRRGNGRLRALLVAAILLIY